MVGKKSSKNRSFFLGPLRLKNKTVEVYQPLPTKHVTLRIKLLRAFFKDLISKLNLLYQQPSQNKIWLMVDTTFCKFMR